VRRQVPSRTFEWSSAYFISPIFLSGCGCRHPSVFSQGYERQRTGQHLVPWYVVTVTAIKMTTATASRQVREAEMQLNSRATYMQSAAPGNRCHRAHRENFVVKRRIHNADFTVGGYVQRWSHFLRQPTKVDSPMQRRPHEDAKTVSAEFKPR